MASMPSAMSHNGMQNTSNAQPVYQAVPMKGNPQRARTYKFSPYQPKRLSPTLGSITNGGNTPVAMETDTPLGTPANERKSPSPVMSRPITLSVPQRPPPMPVPSVVSSGSTGTTIVCILVIYYTEGEDIAEKPLTSGVHTVSYDRCVSVRNMYFNSMQAVANEISTMHNHVSELKQKIFEMHRDMQYLRGVSSSQCTNPASPTILDDITLENAKSGLVHIMGMLSPSQAIQFLNFMQHTIQTYRSESKPLQGE